MRTTRRWSVGAFLAIATIMATMFGAAAASATPANPGYSKPVITASPAAGPVGSTTTVTGDRFTPGASGTITFNSAPTEVGSFTVGADGTWSAIITVPQGEDPTIDHSITASDNVPESANTAFDVTGGSVGGVTVSNPTPTAGESITVSGTSCTPGTTVTVSLDGTTVLGTTSAAADGSYSVVVKIPDGVSGSHQIIVSGAGAGCSGVKDITITASNGGGLANTGVAVIGIGALGAVLLVGGGLMLLAGRRRRTTLV